MVKNYNYQAIAISFASYTSIFLALVPLIYVSNGFSASEIAFLSSMYTFGAIIQPIFNLMTRSFGIRITLLSNLSIILICCLFLLFSSSFIIYALFITLYYIFQAPNISLIDNYFKLISEQTKYKFGTLRAFVSAGWGVGTLIVLPFLYYFENKVILILVVLLVIITWAFIYKTPIIEQKYIKTKQPKKFNFTLFKNKEFIHVLIISTLILGTWTIKSSYQTLLLISKSNVVAVVSVVSIISILMELLIIPRIESQYEKYGYKKLTSIAIIAGIVLTFGYFYVTNILLILLLSCLHGVLCGTMIPLNIFKFRDILKPNQLNSAMLTMYSIQNLFGFIVITLLISKVYINFNVEFVYLTLSIILGVAFILNLFLNYGDIKKDS